MDDIYYNVNGVEVQRIEKPGVHRHFVVDESQANEGKFTVLEEITGEVNAEIAKDAREAALSNLGRHGKAEQVGALLANNNGTLSQPEKQQLMSYRVSTGSDRFNDSPVGGLFVQGLMFYMTAGIGGSYGHLTKFVRSGATAQATGLVLNKSTHLTDDFVSIYSQAVGQVSRAPKGGITIGGQFFKGGQFSPRARLQLGRGSIPNYSSTPALSTPLRPTPMNVNAPAALRWGMAIGGSGLTGLYYYEKMKNR